MHNKQRLSENKKYTLKGLYRKILKYTKLEEKYHNLSWNLFTLFLAFFLHDQILFSKRPVEVF